MPPRRSPSPNYFQDELDAKRKRYTSRLITLRVGPGNDKLSVYEDVLKEDSPFFKAALDVRWKKKGSEATIDLPEDDVDAAVAYVHWLLRYEIVRSRWHDCYDHLARTYVFGEKIQSVGFRNSVLQTMTIAIEGGDDHEDITSYPGPGAIRTTYEGTPEGHPMRDFLVEVYRERAMPDWELEHGEDGYPTEFLVDLARAFVKNRETDHNKSFRMQYRLWKVKA